MLNQRQKADAMTMKRPWRALARPGRHDGQVPLPQARCLALVLAFVGAKMLLTDLYKISIGGSLFIVVVLLTGSIAASLIRPLIEPLQFNPHTGCRRHPWDDPPAEFKP
jgi:hypothetical protein